jgi:hypothetical protein
MRYTRALLPFALTAATAATLPAQATPGTSGTPGTPGTRTTPATPAALRPAPSGRATSEVTLVYPEGQTPQGATPATIRLDYGQPHLRGRALHTDSLVPYGKPWRTGANAATTLRTDVDLVLGGTTLPRGTYVLLTLPSRAGWKLIVQKGEAQSAEQYDAANDVARVDLRRRTLREPVESLTMWLIPSRDAGQARGELRLAWGTVELSTGWSVK